MNNALVVSDKKVFPKKKHRERHGHILNTLDKSASLILIATMFVIGSIVALLFDIPVKSVMSIIHMMFLSS